VWRALALGLKLGEEPKKKTDEDVLRTELNTIEEIIRYKRKRLDELRESRNKYFQAYSLDTGGQNKTDSGSASLLDRITALRDLSKNDSAIFWTNTLLTLLFMIIEISPVLVKSLSEIGAYDLILEQKEFYAIDVVNQELKLKKYQKEAQDKDLYLKILHNIFKNHQIFIENSKYEYQKSKNTLREKMYSIDMGNLKYFIDDIYSDNREIFLKLCEKETEIYQNLVSKIEHIIINEN
jgi:hypothetical protein